MALTQIVYVSRRSSELSDVGLTQIVAVGAERNRMRGVSGLLMMSGGNVMQLLEGDAGEVEPLLARIAADPRHYDVKEVLRKEVSRRLCPDWGMKLYARRDDAALDHATLVRMVEDIQSRHDTRWLTVEARVILDDFPRQVA